MEKPSIPKGTRDFGPIQMAKRQFIIDSIKSVFQTYGFQPLETPAVEQLSTLTGKYGDEGDQLLFKILNSGDFLKNADKGALQNADSKKLSPTISDKGLRYDLTVPLARYVVMNRHEITFPFKRYQVQPVWRADRPQKGRYREFFQCDADVIGTDSLTCEAEIILMTKSIFKKLGITDFEIKLNHRGILSGMAELLNAKEKESTLFVAIDKLEKLGEQKVGEELTERGFSKNDISLVFELLNFKGRFEQKINFLKERLAKSDSGKKGLSDIVEIKQLLSSYGDSFEQVQFDIGLARGLSYYTGTVFEIKINKASVGSVSGGGRYDDLTGVFGLPNVSGVGYSYGIDRLYDAMEELHLFSEETSVSSKVLVAHLDKACQTYGLKVVQHLRSHQIASEIFPDVVKLKKQLEYADKKKIPFVIVIGPDEISSEVLTLKNMKTGDQEKKKLNEIINQF